MLTSTPSYFRCNLHFYFLLHHSPLPSTVPCPIYDQAACRDARSFRCSTLPCSSVSFLAMAKSSPQAEPQGARADVLVTGTEVHRARVAKHRRACVRPHVGDIGPADTEVGQGRAQTVQVRDTTLGQLDWATGTIATIRILVSTKKAFFSNL